MDKIEPSIDEAYRPTSASGPSSLRWQIPAAMILIVALALTAAVGIRFFLAIGFSETRRSPPYRPAQSLELPPTLPASTDAAPTDAP